MKDYVAIAKQYAEEVVRGKVPACRYVKLACQRHLDGLKRQRRRDYPYRLDAAAASRVCAFTELMPHVKGKWARQQERIVIEAWWCFILVCVFGWVRKSDGLRRFRETYIEVPRKNAKSTGTAAVGNFMFTADSEHGAECYSGATTEKQAWEVFGPARHMALNTPEFREAFGVTVGAKNMTVIGTASKFEPIIGKPGDGASPSFYVADEFHEHKTSDQRDTMITGMGAREQPLAWTITTAGFDTSSPCYDLRMRAIEILEAKVEQDNFFAIIYTVDEDDDWTTLAALRKANPNIGVSVFEEFLVNEQKKAINNPRDQATFKTKHLNLWVTAASPYFNSQSWGKLADAPPEVEFIGDSCVIALDLASKLDLAAKVKLFQRELEGSVCSRCHGKGVLTAVDGEAPKKCPRCKGTGNHAETHYYAYGTFYIPQLRAEAPECRHYAGWVEQGHLVATPGNITDYDYIEADIEDDSERNTVLEVAADPHNATQLLTHLQNKLGRNKVVEVPQNVAYLSEPMKEVQALIVDGRLHHDGNPCFAWQMGNVTAQEDRNQNVFPRKEKVESKIDGAVALIIAVGAALRNANTSKPSWRL